MISVFMYHDIRDDKKYPKRYNLKSFLTVNNFKKNLDFITNQYQVIRPSDIPNVDKDGNYAILTFDDGLKDHYDITDVLLSYGVTGTFLIPTLPVTEGKMIHSHKIQFILASESEEKLINNILYGFENPVELYNHYSKTIIKNNWWNPEMIFITNFLRKHENGVMITDKLFNEIVTIDEKEFSSDLYLNENNIIEMVSSGMDIGSHGYTSAILTNDNQKMEIGSSIGFIRKYYDGDVMFSYPNGVYNDKTIELLKQHDCKYSFTTESASITNPNINKLKLPRFDGPQTIII